MYHINNMSLLGTHRIYNRCTKEMQKQKLFAGWTNWWDCPRWCCRFLCCEWCWGYLYLCYRLFSDEDGVRTFSGIWHHRCALQPHDTMTTLEDTDKHQVFLSEDRVQTQLFQCACVCVCFTGACSSTAGFSLISSWMKASAPTSRLPRRHTNRSHSSSPRPQNCTHT